MTNKRLIKTAVFGVMEGPNKPERPRRKWLDDVKEWCNTDINIIFGSAQDRNCQLQLREQQWTALGHSYQYQCQRLSACYDVCTSMTVLLHRIQILRVICLLNNCSFCLSSKLLRLFFISVRCPCLSSISVCVVSTYKTVRLVPRPWKTPEGTVNHVSLKTFLTGVMMYIMENPGITSDMLVQKYARYLQPVPLFELIEVILCSREITSRIFLQLSVK